MALIPLNQQFHTQSGDIDTSNKGSRLANSGRSSFTMQDIVDTVGGVDSKSSVFVKADGTPQENGAALLAAYDEAAAKSTNTTTVAPYSTTTLINNGNGDYLIGFTSPPSDVVLKKNYYADYGTIPAQELIYRVDSNVFGNFYTLYITDIFGNPEINLTLDSSGVPLLSGGASLSTLIVGPGQYDLPSDLITGQDAVSIVSLTGERDVYITGGDIKVSTESNANGRIFSGLDLGSQQNFFIEDGLTDVTFKNIKSTKIFSFCNEGGGGNMSGTFIDCESGSYGFGSSGGSSPSGGHASGTFINCTGNSNSFGSGVNGTITSGLFEGCQLNPFNASGFDNRDAFGNGTVLNGGKFYNCTGKLSCFGSYSENVIAHYENCRSHGFECFGSYSDKNSGTFINCHVSENTVGKNFGAFSTGSVVADTEDSKYYLCTATGDRNFGGSGSGIGCIADGCVFASTSDGVVINCVVRSGSYNTSGSGIIRNSIDGSYNTITLN